MDKEITETAIAEPENLEAKKAETTKERQQKLNNLNSIRANSFNQGSKGKHNSKIFMRRSNAK